MFLYNFALVENFEFYSVIMSYGPGVKILSPQSVVKRMKEQLRQFVANYEPLDDSEGEG